VLRRHGDRNPDRALERAAAQVGGSAAAQTLSQAAALSRLRGNETKDLYLTTSPSMRGAFSILGSALLPPRRTRWIHHSR
jgi:hypothetical protein